MGKFTVPIDNDFGVILNCAVRYSLGRQTYMPHLVINYIAPIIPHLDSNTLYVMINDIESANSYGDETIDKPVWMWFLQQLQLEQHSRKENKNGK